MTSNYGTDNRNSSARNNVQNRPKFESRKPSFEIPEFPLRHLNCPKKYIQLSAYLDGLDREVFSTFLGFRKTIFNLQNEIVLDQIWAEEFSAKRLDTISEEDRKKALEYLKNCQKQWKRAEKVVKYIEEVHKNPQATHDTHVLDPSFNSDVLRIYLHDIDMAQSFIALLGHIIFQVERDHGEDFMSALNQGSRPPDATIDGSRKGHDQGRWREKIEKDYQIHKDAPELDGNKEGRAWCPVLKDFIPKNKGIAAHIVAHATGQDVAKKIFAGQEAGKQILFNRRNGLWMAKNVEKAMDSGYVVIVPTETENPDFELETYDLKLVVLNEELLTNDQNMILSVKHSDNTIKKYYWRDVNGKTLDFRRAQARPAKRYLFFNYLYTICRTVKYKPPNFQDRLNTLGNVGRSWATPGSYLSDGLLNTFKRTADRRLPARSPPAEPTLSDMVSQQPPQTTILDEGMQIASSISEYQDALFIPEEYDPGYASEDSEEETSIARSPPRFNDLFSQ